MTDFEYQNLLAAAQSMTPREASAHFFSLAEQWYRMRSNKALNAFSKHINGIIKLMSSADKLTRLYAIRTIAFVSACPRLHRPMFGAGMLDLVVHALGSSHEAAHCEAALVALSHLCSQSSQKQKVKFAIVSSFCQKQTSLLVIFRFVHVDDRCVSLIANVMTLLAALCTDRRMAHL